VPACNLQREQRALFSICPHAELVPELMTSGAARERERRGLPKNLGQIGNSEIVESSDIPHSQEPRQGQKRGFQAPIEIM